MSDHYYYHLLRNLADTSDSTRRTWFSGFNLSSAGDTALFVFFAGVVSVIFLLYGLSLINCLRATFCPGTLRNRPPTIMMDIDPGLKNLNKKQRRAVLQTFFSVKSVNVINLSEKKCTVGDNADNQNENKEVIVVLMDEGDNDEDLKMKGAPSLEIRDGIEDLDSAPEPGNESIRYKLSSALGRRTPSSLSQQVQEDTPSAMEMSPDNNDIAAIDIQNNIRNSNTEPPSTKKSWWKSLFSRNRDKSEEDESSEESEGSISAIELHDDCFGSDYNDEDCGATCAICLLEYETGDLVINSKMCQHLFHRDCLLEWLEKNDKCPFCRVDMIPSYVMRAAAVPIFSDYYMRRRRSTS